METNSVGMGYACRKMGVGRRKGCSTQRKLYLTQPDEEVKDVGIVVDHGARLHIGGKLRLTLCVQRLIEVVFPLVKLVLAQCDGPVHRQTDCASDWLGAWTLQWYPSNRFSHAWTTLLQEAC